MMEKKPAVTGSVDESSVENQPVFPLTGKSPAGERNKSKSSRSSGRREPAPHGGSSRCATSEDRKTKKLEHLLPRQDQKTTMGFRERNGGLVDRFLSSKGRQTPSGPAAAMGPPKTLAWSSLFGFDAGEPGFGGF
jgi:hypothetical protein